MCTVVCVCVCYNYFLFLLFAAIFLPFSAVSLWPSVKCVCVCTPQWILDGSPLYKPACIYSTGSTSRFTWNNFLCQVLKCNFSNQTISRTSQGQERWQRNKWNGNRDCISQRIRRKENQSINEIILILIINIKFKYVINYN